MARYIISLFERVDPAWLDAVGHSRITPRHVATLIAGKGPVTVTSRVLDAITEWDRGIAKQADCRTGIDFWPAPDVVARRDAVGPLPRQNGN